jgi:hypothetical protein
MTEPRPPAPIDLELRQLASQVRTCAAQIRAGADQILIDAAHGRLVRSAGRDLAVKVTALCEAQAALGQAQKTAARTAREAA